MSREFQAPSSRWTLNLTKSFTTPSNPPHTVPTIPYPPRLYHQLPHLKSPIPRISINLHSNPIRALPQIQLPHPTTVAAFIMPQAHPHLRITLLASSLLFEFAAFARQCCLMADTAFVTSCGVLVQRVRFVALAWGGCEICSCGRVWCGVMWCGCGCGWGYGWVDGTYSTAIFPRGVCRRRCRLSFCSLRRSGFDVLLAFFI